MRLQWEKYTPRPARIRSSAIGRIGARGAAHWNARLNRSAVEDIYRRAKAGESPATLAAEYGITVRYVGDIRRGRRWVSVTSKVSA